MKKFRILGGKMAEAMSGVQHRKLGWSPIKGAYWAGMVRGCPSNNSRWVYDTIV